ncbi:hypothetical protein CR513_45913, partial [Mucuna pruriens]
MPTSVYKSLNFGDLEPTGMTIQLANRSFMHPLGVLEDVLVQVNELIFPTDFHVLDMEDETFGKGSTLILGRPFFMTARTKIDVHVGTLSMEFGDNLVQFNIFEAMKHPTKDHSLFGIDIIDELVAEHLQLEAIRNLVPSLSDFIVKKNNKSYSNNQIGVESNLANLSRKQSKVEIKSAHLVPNLNQVGQSDLNPIDDISPSPPPPAELKSLLSHLKYAYLGKDQ